MHPCKRHESWKHCKVEIPSTLLTSGHWSPAGVLLGTLYWPAFGSILQPSYSITRCQISPVTY
jgi:hypothetical protein